MGFSIFRACMTVTICLLLLALFLFPSGMLRSFADEAEAHIRRAGDALLQHDEAAAERECSALCALAQRSVPALERFLNHSNVTALTSAFGIAYAAVRIGDCSAAYEALSDAETALERLKGIELFSPNSLL